MATYDRTEDAKRNTSPRCVAAALIVVSRYLAGTSPGFATYLRESIDHAAAAGVSADDLALLQTLLRSVGADL